MADGEYLHLRDNWTTVDEIIASVHAQRRGSALRRLKRIKFSSRKHD